MKTRITLLLLAATLCSVHAEQIILDDAVTYELDNTSMTASLVKSAYPYGLMTGYYRETETIRDTIFYEGEKYPVTKIEEKAFYAQVRLKGVTIPSGVKTIGKEAFAECSALPAIELPNSVDSLGDMAFARCTSITTIDIPQAAEVGEGLCAQCYKLVTASIGGNIPNNCFQYCSKLCSITIGNYCTRIGRDAFNGCTALSNIIIPNNVDSIGVQAFMNSGLSVVSIPSNVKKIDESTFAHCSNLESVYLGIGVKRIEKTAFWDCPLLTEITIPEQVEYVGLNAFLGCSSLSSVTWNAKNCAIFDVTSQRPFSQIESHITSFVFGSKVQSIPDNLCNGMKNLKQVTAYMKNPPQISASVFANCGNLKEIVCYVPAESLSAYKTADVWKEFNITAIGQEPVITTYYTVIFKNWNGSVLKTEQVEEGQSATAPANPTREGYTFIGWDKDFSNVQSDLIVTAQYTQNTPGTTYYTVTFKDWDGTVLKTQQVEKGKSATAPANPTREGYTFTGWDKDFSNVQSDLIVTAQYRQNPPTVYYTVTFKDWDGTVLKTQQVEKGKSAIAPADPTRDGYTFIGWDTSFANVQSDLVVTAVYQKNQAPVTNAITVRLKASSVSSWSSVFLWAWTDEGNIFASWPGQKINKDSEGWYSYTFAENVSNVSIIWNNGSGAQTKDITGVTESTCYELNSTSGTQITASIVDCPAEVVYFSVIFKDWDGTILKTEQVEEGKSATAPADPTRYGYTFIGWDKSYTNVHSNLIVTAQYQKNETPTEAITVRLKASSASGWSSVYLWAWTDEGNIFASWPGQEISKDSEGWYSYTFAQDISDVSVIWTNGTGAQTKDITGITESTCYILNSTEGSNIAVSVVDCDAQGIEDIHIDSRNNVQKILYEGQLFILREGKTYTIQGQEVR